MSQTITFIPTHPRHATAASTFPSRPRNRAHQRWVGDRQLRHRLLSRGVPVEHLRSSSDPPGNTASEQPKRCNFGDGVQVPAETPYGHSGHMLKIAPKSLLRDNVMGGRGTCTHGVDSRTDSGEWRPGAIGTSASGSGSPSRSLISESRPFSKRSASAGPRSNTEFAERHTDAPPMPRPRLSRPLLIASSVVVRRGGCRTKLETSTRLLVVRRLPTRSSLRCWRQEFGSA